MLFNKEKELLDSRDRKKFPAFFMPTKIIRVIPACLQPLYSI